jgi:HAD superfamily hydrolase (TIGR01484 family)
MNKNKAIIFDLDGTAIPLAYEGMPSQKVVDTVNKAKEKVFVSCATGRNLPMLEKIFASLNLSDPCVIQGGTQIVNPKSGKILWEKSISKEQVHHVIDVLSPYPYEIGFSEEIKGAPAKNKIIKGREHMIAIWGVKLEDVQKILDKLNAIEDVAAHSMGSWHKERTDIHVTHKEATKKHAIHELIKLLHIESKDIIGVGDQNNDLPLFESVGFKVAMGNGTDLLKSKADYITGSVDEDGLAQAIEKFILSH